MNKKLLPLIFSMFLLLSFTSIDRISANSESQNAWDYVKTLQSNVSDTNKTQPITRGEAAYILAQLKKDTPKSNTTFKDVPATHPYYKEILQMNQIGIFDGYADQTFKPDAQLTRAQLSKILTLYFQLQGEKKTLPFTDTPTNAWYYSYVQTLHALKLTTGTTATTFSPGRHTTRTQFVVFLYRIHLAKDISLTNYKVIAGKKGYGYKDGSAADAQFRSPQSMIKLNGSYFITDSDNHMLRELKGNTVSTYTGNSILLDGDTTPASYLQNGSLDEAMFQNPTNMVVTKDGSMLIADSANHVIRKISTNGTVSTFAGTGEAGLQDGPSKQAKFYMPQGLALASDGSLYVADTLNHVIRKIAPNGVVSTLTNSKLRTVNVTDDYKEVTGDYVNGAMKDAKFNEPTNLVIDTKGNLYVSDSGNHVIRYMDFTKNTVSTYAGTFKDNGIYGQAGMQDGAREKAQFNYPKGLALLPTGELLVADSANNAIRLITNHEVKTVSTTAVLPSGLLVDQQTLFVVESGSGQISQYTISK